MIVSGHNQHNLAPYQRICVLAAGNERGGAATHIAAFASKIESSGYGKRFRFWLIGRGYLQERLEETGVDFQVLEAPLHRVPSELVRAIRRDGEPLVLHAHGPRMNVLARIAAGWTRTPWTSTIHSNPFNDFLASRWKTRLFVPLNLRCLRHANGLFLINPAFTEFFPGQRTVVVPNAVRLEPPSASKQACRQRLRARLNLPEDAPVIGVAARLDPVKDIGTTIRALARLADLGVHFAIAGDGPERNALERLATELDVRDRVHFLGFIDHVRDFYAGLDVHVLSSRSEGTPSSLLEAGQVRVPNVGSRIPGITYVMEDGFSGLCFPVGDDAELAAALRRLLTTPSEAVRLTDNFAASVLPRFSPEQMVTAYLRGYQSLFGLQWIENTGLSPA